MKSITPRRAFAALLATAALGVSHLSGQTTVRLPVDRSDSGSVIDDLDTQARMSRSIPSRQTLASTRPVSADILRHPISDRVRRLLHRALMTMDAGNHESAIGQLKDTLQKHPESAAYAHSFLGVLYVKTRQFQDAVNSFEVAAALLPHDALTHYNFGLSLACVGDYARAEQETRRALELDSSIAEAQTLISVLQSRQATTN